MARVVCLRIPRSVIMSPPFFIKYVAKVWRTGEFDLFPSPQGVIVLPFIDLDELIEDGLRIVLLRQ
jgi:hypothetical protein